MPANSAIPASVPASQHLPASPASAAHTASHCTPIHRERRLHPMSGIAPPPAPAPSATTPSSGSHLPGTRRSSRLCARLYPSAASVRPPAGSRSLPPSPALTSGSGLRLDERHRMQPKVHPALSHRTLVEEISPYYLPSETVFHLLA